MDEVKKIVNDIKARIIKPIYFFIGEEAYYIDRLSEYIEKSVLTEEERGFNQMVMYGKESTIEDIISNAKRYPMMAEHQVIIVKEAQHLAKSIDKLIPYVENPQVTTVLVFCFKYSKLDKRKKIFKLIQKHGVLFESKKLYDNQIPDWIRKVLLGSGYSITPKAAILLAEFLGNDLGKIHNELEKLKIVISKSQEITPEVIEQNIGISKDYNNFELKKALGERNVIKVTRILNYFAQNPKDNPFVVTITLLHSFFTQLLQYHGMNDHNPKSVASVLGIHPFFVTEYQIAAKNYPMKKVSSIIADLRELDIKGKGVGANLEPKELLKELLIKIM
ncbi:DNA polymerase III subunit delta [Cellulophaga sp. Hel_I_12]|uniref:DNA polymerase III subunit delta n=1 Tax=Cellulophaga sp. Hel_I_12 TaxID=1249972 RepID=UPI000647B3C6|nr:DNA polymerase III subunit delta [Cellulophaga sp. Hel_I_12]